MTPSASPFAPVFVGAKEKNCTAEMKANGAGDVWTWVALDADSKLVPCWFIGERHAGCALRGIDYGEVVAWRYDSETNRLRAS